MTPKLAALAAVMLLFAGCASAPEGQNVKVDKSKLDDVHLLVKCPVAVSGSAGLTMKVNECAFEVKDGDKDSTSIACTGLQKSANSPKLNREGTLSVTYYTPGGKQETKQFKFASESGDTHTATCTVTGEVDDHGTYTVRFTGGCLRDKSTMVPGFQAANKACQSQDSTKISRYGGLL